MVPAGGPLATKSHTPWCLLKPWRFPCRWPEKGLEHLAPPPWPCLPVWGWGDRPGAWPSAPHPRPHVSVLGARGEEPVLSAFAGRGATQGNGSSEQVLASPTNPQARRPAAAQPEPGASAGLDAGADLTCPGAGGLTAPELSQARGRRREPQRVRGHPTAWGAGGCSRPRARDTRKLCRAGSRTWPSWEPARRGRKAEGREEAERRSAGPEVLSPRWGSSSWVLGPAGAAGTRRRGAQGAALAQRRRVRAGRQGRRQRP